MSKERILSMAVSVDGFVAGPDGETDRMFRGRGEASTRWRVEQLGRIRKPNASLAGGG